MGEGRGGERRKKEKKKREKKRERKIEREKKREKKRERKNGNGKKMKKIEGSALITENGRWNVGLSFFFRFRFFSWAFMFSLWV